MSRLEPTPPNGPKPTISLPLSLAIGVVICLPGLVCSWTPATVTDADVWWHARTGEWIAEHGAVPTLDPFSQATDAPFVAYSWGAELLLHGLYAAFGLHGFVLYTALLVTAISLVVFRLLRHAGAEVVPAGAFFMAAMTGFIICGTPRPWLFSVLFFVLQLDILLIAGKTGRRRVLLWLIPIYALWANLHIQFIAGLAVLGLAVVESFVATHVRLPFVSRESRAIAWPWMAAALVLAVAATGLNPYGYRLYETAVVLMSQGRLWNHVTELKALPFRHVSHWMVLIMGLAAMYALGRRRRTRLLWIVLLLGGAYLGFKSQRDSWIVLMTSALILAETFPSFGAVRERIRLRPQAIAAAMTFVLAAYFGLFTRTPSELETAVRKTLPVDAAAFVRDAGYEGPLFNDYTWGGFLIRQLPELPVSLDGRTIVHGEDRILTVANILKGKPGWDEDAGLNHANVVLLPRGAPLAQLLRCDARFTLVYEDDVAVVYVSDVNYLKAEPVLRSQHALTQYK